VYPFRDTFGYRSWGLRRLVGWKAKARFLYEDSHKKAAVPRPRTRSLCPKGFPSVTKRYAKALAARRPLGNPLGLLRFWNYSFFEQVVLAQSEFIIASW